MDVGNVPVSEAVVLCKFNLTTRLTPPTAPHVTPVHVLVPEDPHGLYDEPVHAQFAGLPPNAHNAAPSSSCVDASFWSGEKRSTVRQKNLDIADRI